MKQLKLSEIKQVEILEVLLLASLQKGIPPFIAMLSRCRTLCVMASQTSLTSSSTFYGRRRPNLGKSASLWTKSVTHYSREHVFHIF